MFGGIFTLHCCQVGSLQLHVFSYVFESHVLWKFTVSCQKSSSNLNLSHLSYIQFKVNCSNSLTETPLTVTAVEKQGLARLACKSGLGEVSSQGEALN